MSYQVTVLPERQSFVTEGRESVLEAALRAGVALDYGCANGNCGLCKARLISGELRKIKAADYVLTEAEKAQGDILLCAHAATSDVTIEALAAHGVEDIPEQRMKARIRSIETVNADVAVLKVRTPRSQRLRFFAGQYAVLSVPGLPVYETAIASCPCDDLNLEFHVRRSEGEPFSEAVFNSLKSGDSLDVVAPRGKFVFDDDFRGPLVFVAFDTGFAAIKSLLEHATAQNEERPIHLYWIACGAQGQYLENLCRSWGDALDQFSYRPLCVAEEYAALAADSVSAQGLVAGLFQQILQETNALKYAGFSLLAQAQCYVAAPEPLLASARQAFSQAGVEPARVKLEPVRGNRNLSCLLAEEKSP